MRQINYVSADETIRTVRTHDRALISSAAHVPFILIEARCRRADAGEKSDIYFHHSYTEGPVQYADPKYQGIFINQAFFVGPTVRPNVNHGIADYIPIHLSEPQRLYCTGAVRCDVAMVSVSSPSMGRYVSLGGSVDCSIAALEVSKTKIASQSQCTTYIRGCADSNRYL